MLLNCHKVQKSYGADTILADVTFTLEEKEKAALVGVNGAGKTTLFKILIGETEADSGEISMAKQIRIGYLPQIAELPSDNTIMEELLAVFAPLIRLEQELRDLEKSMSLLTGEELESAMADYDRMTGGFEKQKGYEIQSRVKGVAKGLGFSESEWEQPIRHLSGGQKTRVALGKLLLSEPDLLLLDEPTNHLDIESVMWLEDYLKGYGGALLAISHDRYFLDKVAVKIVEIENRKSKVYAGNYSMFARHKETDREVMLKTYLDQQKEIRRQEDVIARLRSFNREKSVRQAESKGKRLEKMGKMDRPESMPDKMRVILTPKLASGHDVLDAEQVSKAFGQRALFDNVSFSIKKGDKAALIGPNGIGKTTLLKMILEELPFEKGNIRRGVNVRAGYYDQEHENLSGEKSVLAEISDTYPQLGQSLIRNVLAAFVFTGDDVFKPISALSGGEKGRVALAKIMLGGANFLILDEPTNHLDIISKEILEAALRDYPGAVLYISHDRYFINNTADKILELRKNGVTVYLGNYDFYLEQKRRTERDKKDAAPAMPECVRENVAHKHPTRKNFKSQLSKIEQEIQEMEARAGDLSRQLELDGVGRDAELANRYYTEKIEVEARLASLYEQWENLAEECSHEN
jgi:ATP-binding cassette subfamily F protein 3